MKIFKSHFVSFLSAIVIYALLSTPAVAAGDKSVANIHSALGGVMVKSVEGAAWSRAEAGKPLFEGDIVRTDPGATTFISFHSGHIIKMDPLSELQITLVSQKGKSQKVNLDLGIGRSFIKVNKISSGETSFNVTTPTAVAGVRGTEFAILVNEDKSTEIALLNGRLEVTANDQSTMLGERESITVVADQAELPAPTEASEEVILQMEKESKEIQDVENDIDSSDSSNFENDNNNDKVANENRGSATTTKPDGTDSDDNGAPFATEDIIIEIVDEITNQSNLIDDAIDIVLDDFPPLPPR